VAAVATKLRQRAFDDHACRTLNSSLNPTSVDQVRGCATTHRRTRRSGAGLRQRSTAAQRREKVPEFRKNQLDGNEPSIEVSEETISQVGKAVAHVAKVQQAYSARLGTAQTDDEKESLAQQAETAAIRAIREQGLSVDQYNQVVNAAEEDLDLQERVLAVARAT
jgi:hypothetical protein